MTISEDEARFVLNEMAPDDRTALLAELPPEQAERFINLLDLEERTVPAPCSNTAKTAWAG